MIYKLFKSLKRDFKIIEVLPQKPTARNPISVIVKIEGHKKYVVIANNDIQKFYLYRSIEKQKEFYNDFSPYFKFNFPDEYGDIEDLSYAIYPYIENAEWVIDDRPLEIIREIYQKQAKTYTVNDELISKIQQDFLSAWPEKFQQKIKTSHLFTDYFDKIKLFNEIKLYKEYSDYAVNNILTDGKDMYLIDFEFSKNCQPIGHDEYCFIASQLSQNINKIKHTENTDNLDKINLFKEKSELVNFANDIVDNANRPSISLLNEVSLDNNQYTYKIEESDNNFYIPIQIIDSTAISNLQLKRISPYAFNKMVLDLFKNFRNIAQIYVILSANTYNGLILKNYSFSKLPCIEEGNTQDDKVMVFEDFIIRPFQESRINIIKKAIAKITKKIESKNIRNFVYSILRFGISDFDAPILKRYLRL